MKIQRRIILILSIFFFICTGCGKNLSEEWTPVKDHIFYPAKNLSSFTISETGNVITAVYNEERKQKEICIYSLDGNLIEKQEIASPSIQAMAVQGEDLYFVDDVLLGEVPKLYHKNSHSFRFAQAQIGNEKASFECMNDYFLL